MSLPVVAIVGRPNVGKSSLLNCIARRRIGIVDPTAGVTRDRISTVCSFGDLYFELVDTGGFGIEDCDDLTADIERQIRFAIAQSAVVLFVVDARDGLTALDGDVARLLRQYDRQVLLVANKVDDGLGGDLGDFHRLGFGAPLAVSALHKVGRRRLLEILGGFLEPLGNQQCRPPELHIAVVGKRNAGKSTFINAIAGEERVIVSEVPGTTRDAVDVHFEKDGKTFNIIDTAGVRKKGKMAGDIEFYSFVRAQQSIVRADVVMLFIDAAEAVSQVDKQLTRFISGHDKPCILVINKWDLAKGKAGVDAYEEYFTKTMPELGYAPIAAVSARDNRGVQPAIDLALSLFKQSQARVSTADLNQALAAVTALRGPSPKRGIRPLKIYYGTQVAIRPPTLVLFVNDPGRVGEDYRRFLMNRFRELLPFREIPIRLVFRSHRRQDRPAEISA